MTRVVNENQLRVPTGVPTWSLTSPVWVKGRGETEPQIRLIIDNDFAGDPDDLFQLVHHLLSPSVDIRAIVCSHADEGAGPDSTAQAERVVRQVLRLMGLTDTDLLVQGANQPLAMGRAPQDSAAARAIVAEANRPDARRLFYAAGGGLTDLALAYLLDPTIAEKLTLVWIGGLQHNDVAGRPGRYAREYNRDLDLAAAQLVFSAGIPIWQVPRDVYRVCVVAESELRARCVRDGGPVGAYLYDEIRHVLEELAPRIGRAEMYPMGDQPLVLLTVLQGVVELEDDFTSNTYVVKPTPQLTDAGTYLDKPDAALMRVYTGLDLRLVFEDFFTKLSEFAAWQEAARI